MVRDNPIHVLTGPKGMQTSSAVQLLALNADRMNLTLEEVFEPGALCGKQLRLGLDGWRTLILVIATDGWCYALVRGVTELGRLILEPASAPLPGSGGQFDAAPDRMAAARAAKAAKAAERAAMGSAQQ